MDESTGEVYWSLYAMVIELQDVKLDLLVDPSGG